MRVEAVSPTEKGSGEVGLDLVFVEFLLADWIEV
jgi:hypothetical protein